jgi:ankyrin repeat protein
MTNVQGLYVEWLRFSTLATLILAGAPALAQPIDSEVERTMSLVVMIQGTLDREVITGAGILVGRDANRVYIVTANHVVRRGDREAAGIRVLLKRAPDRWLDAVLAPHNDPGPSGLDVAVLAIDNLDRYGFSFCSLPLDRLGRPESLARGSAVYPVGYPRGQIPWSAPAAPDAVTRRDERDIHFQSGTVTGGYSGGALLTRRGELVGLIKQDEGLSSVATDIGSVLRMLRQWGYPVQLRTPGTNVASPLHEAIGRLDVNAVRLLVQNCADVQASDRQGRTPLQLAAASDSVVIAGLLIEAEAKVDAGTDGRTPLDVAAEHDAAEVAKLLLSRGAVVARGRGRTTPLVTAVQHGSTKVAALLISAGAEINASDGFTAPLHVAAARRDPRMIELLIANHADVNAVSSYHRDTPLAAAILGERPLMPVDASTYARELVVVRRLLAAGAVVKDTSVQSALVWAVYQSLDEIVRLLLSAGIDPNLDGYADLKFTSETRTGISPLEAAVLGRKIEMVDLLLSHGANVNEDIRPLNVDKVVTVAHAAVLHGDIETLKVLIKHKADLSLSARDNDWSGKTPLHSAIESGNAAMTRLLLDAGSNLEAATFFDKDRPLHVAVKKGNVVLATLLLDRDANIDARAEWGETPLHLAVRGGQLPMVKLLLERGADVNVADRSARYDSPLHEAVKGRHVAIAELLLKSGADVNADDGQGFTPLRAASETEQLQLVNLLLDKGANVSGRRPGSFTALHDAVWEGHVEVVRVLVKRGANLEATSTVYYTEVGTVYRCTPLHLAAIQGHVEVLTVLLDAGAKVEPRTSDDQTPLALAVKAEKRRAAALLRDRGATR